MLQRLTPAVREPALAMSFTERPPTTIFEALDRGHCLQSMRTFAGEQGPTPTGLDAGNTAPTPRPQQPAWPAVQPPTPLHPAMAVQPRST